MTEFACICFLFCACPQDKPVVISDFCQSTEIMRPSRNDTPETLRQIAKANAKRRAVCKDAGK